MLKYLKIWQKFALVAAAFTIPMFVLLHYLRAEHAVNVEFAKAEKRGVIYELPLVTFFNHLNEHRDLYAGFSAGNAALKQDLDKNEAAIETDIKSLDAVDADHGKFFASTETLHSVESAWKALKTQLAGKRPEESFALHDKLIHETTRLLFLVGNASNLILDPDVDSYWTMDSIFTKTTKLNQDLSETRATAMAFIVAGGSGEAAAAARASLTGYVSKVEDALDQRDFFEAYAMDANKDVKSAIGPLIDASTKAAKDAIDLLTTKVIKSDTPQASMAQIADAFGVAMAANQSLSNEMSKQLDNLLDIRLSGFQSLLMKEYEYVGIALLLSIVLLFFVVRAITKPVAMLSRVADQISLGELETKIEINTKDEIGVLSEGFRRMQTSLKAAMDQLEARDTN